MGKIYHFRLKKKIYDIFEAKKLRLEALYDTVEIPTVVEEKITMAYEEILQKKDKQE